MMSECPKCGSAEIVQDLLLFTGYGGEMVPIAYASMADPNRKEDPVEVGFRVDVCGACGYTEMHTNWPADLLAAAKKGMISREAG